MNHESSFAQEQAYVCVCERERGRNELIVGYESCNDWFPKFIHVDKAIVTW